MRPTNATRVRGADTHCGTGDSLQEHTHRPKEDGQNRRVGRANTGRYRRVYFSGGVHSANASPGGSMRALTWVSAGMLSLASGTWLFAQDSAKAEAHDHGPPSSIHLLPSDGSYLQYELSDPAYVAAFEVYSGGGAELLYPYASSDYAEVVGMHVHELSYLTDEVEERQALLASYPLQASWACVYVVASRQPLRLEWICDPSARAGRFARLSSVSMTNPEAGLAPILDSERPANPGDWAIGRTMRPDRAGVCARRSDVRLLR